MTESNMDQAAVLQKLNEILELELAGVIRYTHYSFMVYGHSRIPIISWIREQAAESLLHAHEAGELVTHLNGEPSLRIGALLERHSHDIDVILEDSLAHENRALTAYGSLLGLVRGRSVMLEEYAARMISEETRHAGAVKKMLRPPSD